MAPLLLAPDSFKGTLSAAEVARALARGIERAGGEADRCPVGDGGEGTLDALHKPLGLELAEAEVSDPLGRPVCARYGLGDGIAVVEVAAASGLGLVVSAERDAVAASSAGTGALIAATIRAGAREVLVCAGGSATTDGGAGAIRALRRAGGLGGARLVVLCDVRTPFEDAARVFGPQKGAGPQEVVRLEQRLGALARRLPRDPRGHPLTGAAGGLSGGLWAAFGASLVPGAPFVLEAVGFGGRMRRARAVITGEGCLDAQSLAGKVVSEVATQARQSGVPCLAVAGRSELDPFQRRILDLEAVYEAGTTRALSAAGGRIWRELAVW
ncbi:MAG TPA: glycerate kinase [Solirubrobacteraceae bacterium]|nr:glycerate kinase [Solirubrobacteraceae bacterium]